jgi:hypothetical protein
MGIHGWTGSLKEAVVRNIPGREALEEHGPDAAEGR